MASCRKARVRLADTREWSHGRPRRPVRPAMPPAVGAVEGVTGRRSRRGGPAPVPGLRVITRR
ncbi:hypothetical protein Afil01_41340 [Actinorhabdospora filicis]|uniref:Uncharacterized protein n=1 Tax=Actinorhabdospora filicis TaxID=1785913 RepID=A0A9W6W4J1_9ACTN|nr:hypothetical protein Afil01_41340 [Actinorhabdospora filicis]